MTRWESTAAERRAVLESSSRVLDLVLVVLLLAGMLVLAVALPVAG